MEFSCKFMQFKHVNTFNETSISLKAQHFCFIAVLHDAWMYDTTQYEIWNRISVDNFSWGSTMFSTQWKLQR